jgi:hypothetical protein
MYYLSTALSFDDYLEEVSFSTKQFCAIAISETIITQGTRKSREQA